MDHDGGGRGCHLIRQGSPQSLLTSTSSSTTHVQYTVLVVVCSILLPVTNGCGVLACWLSHDSTVFKMVAEELEYPLTTRNYYQEGGQENPVGGCSNLPPGCGRRRTAGRYLSWWWLVAAGPKLSFLNFSLKNSEV